MRAHELEPGRRFRVVGLPLVWECLAVQAGGVHVRPVETESRSFETTLGDKVTFSFRPRAFYISRETDVEVAP